MPATRAAAYLDALVAVWRAALPGVTVSDGPPLSDDAYEQLVCVGWDLFSPDDDTAADIEQTWRDSGSGAVGEETVTLLCSVLAQNGDQDIAAVRTAATLLLLSLTDALRPAPGFPADSSLGVPGVMWARLAVGRLVQRQTDLGVCAGYSFTVQVRSQV
jgi:hypothetical protein